MTASTIDLAVRLRAAGLRVTRPRRAILDLLASKNVPATIEEIHESLRLEQCDLVTVYRCMDAFEGIGLVRRLYARNGAAAFVMAGNEEPLFVATHKGFIPANAGLLAHDLRRTTMTIERHLHELGYRDVVALIEFFGDTASKT